MPLEPYNELSELEDIKLRYTNVQHSISYTLMRLKQSPLFLAIVEQLKSEGWKEWHLLQAIFNGLMSWYAERSGANQDIKRLHNEGNILFHRLLEVGESSHDPSIPPEYFTLKTMHTILQISIMTFLTNKGAAFGARSYNPERMETIARNRYHYFELDIPHTPIFPSMKNE